MRLLLDEMWPPAVAERAEWRGQPDDVIFAIAQAKGRAIVTENVSDYRPLAAHALRSGRSHWGVVFSNNRALPRGDARAIGRAVAALDALLAPGLDQRDLEHWLV